MTGPEPDPTPLRDALAQVQAELGLPAAGALQILHSRWDEVVGADVAPHVQLVALRDGTAVLSADSSLWASQLRYLETEIIDRLNALAGAPVVHTIRVRVHPR